MRNVLVGFFFVFFYKEELQWGILYIYKIVEIILL